MPFGDVSGRVGHILGPSVEFAFWAAPFGPTVRACTPFLLRFAHEALKNQLQHHPHAIRTRRASVNEPTTSRAQRTAISSSTLPTCLHCALHRAKYELCDGMMLRRSSSVPLQLSRSHPTARRRATGTPRSSRERSAPAPAGPRTCAVHDPHPCDPEAPGASILSFGCYRYA